MSQARNFADLLASGTTLQPSKIPTIDASKLDLTDDYAFTGTVSGAGNIIAAHHFADATRNISLSNSTVRLNVIGFNFTKQSANSDLIVWGRLPCSQQNSYHAGTFIEIDGSLKYDACHYMSPPPGQNTDDHVHGGLFMQGCWTDINTAGSKTVYIGFHPRDATSQRPSNKWNTSEAFPRMRGQTCQLTILEVEPAKLTTIT